MKLSKKTLLTFCFLSFSWTGLFAQYANPWAVDLSRMFAKEIFELNGIPYLQPMVETVNATSNSRFFYTAKVPKKVDKLYIKFGFHAMLGFVRDDMKNYHPAIPNEKFNILQLTKYGSVDFSNQTINITDTAGLYHYLFKNLVYDGLQDGSIEIPDQSATILGNQVGELHLSNENLKRLAENHFLWQFLTQAMKDSVYNVLSGFPQLFSLPKGANLNNIFAFIPQVEIGSYFGTELLLRYIPYVDLGKNIGDFTFWGIGLKHSVSQYFDDLPFDIAIQGVIQGTSLENKVGVTNSEFKSDATFMNLNLHASTEFYDNFTFFAGLSYEKVDIDIDFKYYLPVEVQIQLGLRDVCYDENGNDYPCPPDPDRGFPGDTNPQTSKLTISDTNIKFVSGIAAEFDPFIAVLDYNISKFNILSFAIIYKI